MILAQYSRVPELSAITYATFPVQKCYSAGNLNTGKIPLTITRGCTLPNTQFQLLALVLVSQAMRVRHFRGFIRPEFKATTLGYFGIEPFKRTLNERSNPNTCSY